MIGDAFNGLLIRRLLGWSYVGMPFCTGGAFVPEEFPHRTVKRVEVSQEITNESSIFPVEALRESIVSIDAEASNEKRLV